MLLPLSAISKFRLMANGSGKMKTLLLCACLFLLQIALCHSPYTRLNNHALDLNGWTGWGGDIQNDRWVRNSTISSVNILNIANLTTSEHELAVCKKTFHHGVSATPTFLDGIAYFPAWDGNFYAIDYVECKVRWSLNVTHLVLDYAPVTTDQLMASHTLSRTSPQIEDNVLHFGTLIHALVVAVELDTGKVIDILQVNPHPYAVLTASPTFYNGTLIIGASSNEEIAAGGIPGYVCCSFKGNVMGLILEDRKYHVTWNISMIPKERTGWAGAAVWGSQPSVDASRNIAFIATGNTYSAPEEYENCENNRTNTTASSEGSDPCLPCDVWQESVLALDVTTGKVNWAHQLTPLDAWVVACGWPPNHPRNNALCPNKPGPDAGKLM